MTAALQRRPNGTRLPFGEWFNAIVDFINTQFTAKALQTVAAAGASQGNATAVNANLGHVIVVTVTASTEGIKLPTASTGDRWTVLANPTVGVKVYPPTGGAIAAGATNASFAVAKATASIFVAVNKTAWRVIKGG